MKKGKLNPRERKRLARLNRELIELYAIACKRDLDEGFAIAGEKLNTRFESKYNEVKRLRKLNGG